ncbi:MAG: ABC transporter substrate-binding protein [Collimonas sp.]
MKKHMILFTLLAATSVTALADQLADIKAKGELVCGVLGTDEPFSFIQDPAKREIVGYEVDLCNAIAKRIGVKASLKQLAGSARIPELEQGRVDLLAASLTHNKEREAKIDFSYSTFITGQKLMVKKNGGIQSAQQLDGKKVLTVKGTTAEQNIKTLVPTAIVVSFDTNPQALLALEQGKGAAYANDETTLIQNYVQLGPDAANFTLLPQMLAIEPLALGLKKNEPAFRQVVNSVLADLEKSGEAEKLFVKWFGPQTKMKFSHRDFKIDSDKISS